MIRITATLFLVVASSVASTVYPDELYKCEDPETPLRFVTSEAGKEEPPKCDKWVEIRGISAKVAAALEGSTFEAANQFLSTVASIEEDKWGSSFPVVATGELFSDPRGYGFERTTFENAMPGSFVVYRSLAGVLVETRATESDPWDKQILYPSRAAGFTPVLGDLNIPGESEPMIIAPSQEKSVAPAVYRKEETATSPGGAVAAAEGDEEWEEMAEGMEDDEEYWGEEAEAAASPDP